MRLVWWICIWFTMPLALVLLSAFNLRFMAAHYLAPAPLLHPGFYRKTNNSTVPFAHRGSRGLFPQNTMFAFAASYAMMNGDDAVLEMDLRLTKDGKVVICHDEYLGGITGDSNVRVEDSTLEELKQLDFGYFPSLGEEAHHYPYRGRGVKIPEFTEVLRAFPKALLNVELKIPGILGGWFNGLHPDSIKLAERVCDLIRKHNAVRRTLVMSFSDLTWFRFRQICPEVPTAAGPLALLHLSTSAWIGLPNVRHALPYNAAQIYWPMAKWKRLVTYTQSLGVAVHVWTINEVEEMRRMITYSGVDGIMTDRLDLLLNLLDSKFPLVKDFSMDICDNKFATAGCKWLQE